MSRRFFLLLAVFAVLPLAHAHAQDDNADHAPATLQVVVMRERHEGRSVFRIQADGVAHASPQRAWQVLTDYEGLPAFVPNLRVSRILSRSDGGTVLEQESSAGFLFLRQRIRLVVRVTESPWSAIDVALVSSDDMKQYGGRWQVEALRDGTETRLRYTGYIEPQFFVPPLFGPAMVKGDVRKMVSAVIAEIDGDTPHPQVR